MAKATFRYEGRSINHTPAADVAAGDVVVQGEMVGITKTPILTGIKGAIAVEGVFDIVKVTGTMTTGDPLFWDANGDPEGGVAGSGAATKTGADNALLGYAIEAAASGDTTARVLLTRDVPSAGNQVTLIPVENLGVGVDISARPVFASPGAVDIESIGILTQGAPAGVDDSNTAVIAVKDDAGNIVVSKTYDTANQPPTSDFADLGALDATHKVLAATEHLTASVTQGTTADLPALLLVIKHN